MELAPTFMVKSGRCWRMVLESDGGRGDNGAGCIGTPDNCHRIHLNGAVSGTAI